MLEPRQRSFSPGRTTIGLLITGAVDPNNRSIWAGTAAACREAGVNLVCYPGRFMHSPIEFEAQRNVIYGMVNAQTVDGLVIMGGLNTWMDREETSAFIQRFQPRPVITTGVMWEGVPSVTVDNYHGMSQVITHLIADHQRRRIAW